MSEIWMVRMVRKSRIFLIFLITADIYDKNVQEKDTKESKQQNYIKE